MPNQLTRQTSLGLPLPPRAGAEEPVALRAAKPSETLKKPPVNRMRQRIRKLPPTHYTLYRSAVSLLEYTYRLIEKFPKSEKLALAHDIRRRTEDVVELVLEAVSFYSKDKNREALLRTTDLQLKMIAVLVEYAYKKRYITDQNLTAWANKLCTLDDEVMTWAMNIAKQAKSGTINAR
jgi:hypothetical protein